MLFMIFKTLNNIPKTVGTITKRPYYGDNYRSNMMLNPLELKHLNSIDDHREDMITLNLEDGISVSRKGEALANIAIFLSHLEESKSFITVRTNPLSEGGEDEIKFLNDFGFDAIRVAKIRTTDDIKKALSLLSNDKELHISIETKEAFDNLSTFGIDDRLTTAHLGVLDLLSDLGLPQSIVSLSNPTMDYILSRFLIDSHIARLKPFSFMFQDYHDTDTFEKWCIKESMMGFESKACLGPKQVDIANRVFGIDESQIQRARDIKELFERNSRNGINGFMDDRYGFIDEPIYRDSLLILKDNI